MLFKSYCTSLYTSQFWFNYKSPTIKTGYVAKLYAAYHKVLKMFLGLSKYESSSAACTYTNEESCSALIWKMGYKFMCRLKTSNNDLITTKQNSSIWFRSPIREN